MGMELADLAPCLEYPHMNVRQVAIVLFLQKAGRTKLRDVASGLKLSKASVSRNWDSLSVLGLIKRIRELKQSHDCISDGRNVYAELTDKGREFAERIGR
jgi:DNA-binding MarR family transcriptional regulator